jgi:hypothetical protein
MTNYPTEAYFATKNANVGGKYMPSKPISFTETGNYHIFAHKLNLKEGDSIEIPKRLTSFGTASNMVITDKDGTVTDVVLNTDLGGYSKTMENDSVIYLTSTWSEDDILAKVTRNILSNIQLEDKINNLDIQVEVDGLNKEIDSLNTKIDNYINSDETIYLALFDKAIFIGDSVTDGHVIDKTLGISRVVRAMSYPTKLGKIASWLETVNLGHSGISIQGYNGSTSYFDTFINNKENAGLCFIELGWNQSGDYSWPSSIDNFEAEMDANVRAFVDDYGSYILENSAVANYCQLIKKIQAESPYMTIILVASMGWGSAIKVEFVKRIAEWGDLLFLDLSKYSPDGGDGVHFTPFGYAKKANVVFKLTNELLKENKDYVKENIYRFNSMISS